jgi:hypothetical protein
MAAKLLPSGSERCGAATTKAHWERDFVAVFGWNGGISHRKTKSVHFLGEPRHSKDPGNR